VGTTFSAPLSKDTDSCTNNSIPQGAISHVAFQEFAAFVDAWKAHRDLDDTNSDTQSVPVIVTTYIHQEGVGQVPAHYYLLLVGEWSTVRLHTLRRFLSALTRIPPQEQTYTRLECHSGYPESLQEVERAKNMRAAELTADDLEIVTCGLLPNHHDGAEHAVPWLIRVSQGDLL